MLRTIIHIDEAKCNGCGLCAQACHEGAIAMVDEKAHLMREDYCDGLGDCLPACPTGAISFVEREAAAYDAAAVYANMQREGGKTRAGDAQPGATAPAASGQTASAPHQSTSPEADENPAHTGCPGARARVLHPTHVSDRATGCATSQAPMAPADAMNAVLASELAAPAAPTPFAAVPAPARATSELSNWPVQIKLAPVSAPYFDGANLLVAADCCAYAYGAFHSEFMRNKVALIGCPKLDGTDYAEKLCQIIAENDIKSVTICRMEVPCCGGLEHAAKTALQNSGKFIPWQVVTISTDGRILDTI